MVVKGLILLYLAFLLNNIYLFHDRGPYHIETSPFISRAYQLIGFHERGTSPMKELILVSKLRQYSKMNTAFKFTFKYYFQIDGRK